MLSPWEPQGWSVEQSLDVAPVSKAAPGTNPLPNPGEASCILLCEPLSLLGSFYFCPQTDEVFASAPRSREVKLPSS